MNETQTCENCRFKFICNGSEKNTLCEHANTDFPYKALYTFLQYYEELRQATKIRNI